MTEQYGCWMEPPLPDREVLGLMGGEWSEKTISSLRREDVDQLTVYVGAGTCGLGAGAGKTIVALRAALQERGISFQLVEVGCIGLCSAEPLVDFQFPGQARVSFQNMTADRVPQVVEEILAGEILPESVLGQFRSRGLQTWPGVPFLDEHPFFAPQTRWVLANCGLVDPQSLAEYVARGGYQAFCQALQGRTPAEIAAMVTASGLRGRGGGGFPTGSKWQAAMETPAEQKYLICNADEGDPGAFMDRAVIEGDPFRLLEGMAIAAYAIGASKAYVYIRAEYPLAIARLEHAIAQAERVGLIGDDILGSGFNLHFVIKKGAGAFVCGEETALIHSIEGKRGMPRPRPPYPAVRGLFGKPTVINNVETLANLPLLAAKGGDWFAALGTDKSRGTKVFAVSGKVSRTGLVEVAMGTSIREIVFQIAGGIPHGREFKAVQIGGPSGGCLPMSQVETAVDYEKLKQAGAMMGSGGLVVMDEKTCMVDVAKFFMDFIQRESCGKCIPCREGTKRMLEILESITRSRETETELEALERFQGITQLVHLGGVIRETSLCGLGQTAPNPVLATLRWFRDEYEAHIFERRCPAGVCQDLLAYRIDQDRCIGCTKCAKACPQGAICGEKKKPHQIVLHKCVKCGACIEKCPVHAVTVS